MIVFKGILLKKFTDIYCSWENEWNFNKFLFPTKGQSGDLLSSLP
jgi:hypothetical protein